ncbi:unnamed protein product [Rotaria sordida]|uniref:Uncharacterized protein n=1 Tax=Rotaria sordida TaxID=392033 RepID=A0A815GHR9_9BILA|nr:unnamed protein product [Rotaria sordida]CAF1596200.1 unnamed protein product [Rotaria sordida]
MINHNAVRRIQLEPQVTQRIKSPSNYGSAIWHAHALLTKKNKEKLTPLHVAIQAGHLDVINEMLKYADASVITTCDDQQRTSLHMAAAKGEKMTVGHVGIVDAFLDHRADSHVCDINEWTPLHHAKISLLLTSGIKTHQKM